MYSLELTQVISTSVSWQTTDQQDCMGCGQVCCVALLIFLTKHASAFMCCLRTQKDKIKSEGEGKMEKGSEGWRARERNGEKVSVRSGCEALPEVKCVEGCCRCQ